MRKTNTKDRLVIISDLWGSQNSDWLQSYIQVLQERFTIHYYDSCKFGQIDTSNYNQENLHQQFIDGGIQKAVDQLTELEKNKVNILTFSIGGLIAWKYGLATDKIISLVCVSSTRLRYETHRPNGTIQLFYGTKDEYRPSVDWLENMGLDYEHIDDQGYHLYTDPTFAEKLGRKLISTIK